MAIWDEISQFIASVEAAEARLRQQQNGLNITTPSGGGGGSGYQVDPAELQSLLTQWQDLLDTLTTAVLQVEMHTTTINPSPAEDNASLTAGNATTGSMSAYLTHLQGMQKYAAGYVQTLQKALKNYQAAEQGNTTSARNVHTSLKG